MSDDGRSDFDFIFGSWIVWNRKLVDVADPYCEDWVEFEASSEAFPILDRSGHVDRMYVKDPPDGEGFEGFTLRLFDPASRTWKIWWSSTRAPGVLDAPVEGRFEADRGVFECEAEIAGRLVRVRFEWLTADKDAPSWQQSFSYDGGQTWTLNWVMNLQRASSPTVSRRRTPTGPGREDRP